MRLRARNRDSLGRFLSPQLVEHVVQNKVRIERGGDERQVTVLFADIRGFTSLTERTRATDVVSLLNEYFDQMVEVMESADLKCIRYRGDDVELQTRLRARGTTGRGRR